MQIGDKVEFEIFNDDPVTAVSSPSQKLQGVIVGFNPNGYLHGCKKWKVQTANGEIFHFGRSRFRIINKEEEGRMDNLFYSKNEKRLFWIAGYTDNNPGAVASAIMLIESAKKLAGKAEKDPTDVNTFFVDESNRYKNMRVYWVDTEKIPEDAFIIDGNWTMMNWIR